MSTSIRVLAFAGSTRKESFNNRLVRVAEEGARQAGAEVTHIDLRDYRLPLFDQDDESEHGKPDHALTLTRLMIGHEAFILASPEYNSSITGVLKNTIDWVSRADADGAPGLAAFQGKVVTLMSASPGSLGGLRGLVHLRSILGNLGCLVLPGQVAVAKAHHAFHEDGSLADERQHQRVVALGQTLVSTAAKLLR